MCSKSVLSLTKQASSCYRLGHPGDCPAQQPRHFGRLPASFFARVCTGLCRRITPSLLPPPFRAHFRLPSRRSEAAVCDYRYPAAPTPSPPPPPPPHRTHVRRRVSDATSVVVESVWHYCFELRLNASSSYAPRYIPSTPTPGPMPLPAAYAGEYEFDGESILPIRRA
ncbi:hypothetical protein DFH09DRAFT_1301213 [Mycena vulgaris]|nr:hypothetical protein DFH09DRAFT_1301213 [Mycena vulgaris]